MPTVGEVYLTANPEDPEKGYASRFNHKNETARPGYYSVRLEDDNILAELTVTTRTGFHRYSFPATARANIILDLTHRDKVIDSALTLIDDHTIAGWRRSEQWARDQIVYFVAEFSRPFSSYEVAVDNKPTSNLKQVKATNIKAVFRFNIRDASPVLVKVGLSATGIEGARRNLTTENPGWDFDQVTRAATQAWNAELRKIEVKGTSEAQLKTFYTALYHALIVPNVFMDVDGKYLGRDFQIHNAQDFTYYTVFSLWDTFRAAHPLYTLIEQKRTVEFIKTFLAQYEQGGRLPVWELAANETDTMIGYHAVSVIADAAVKGIRGFDLARALEAMKHSAEEDRLGLRAYKNQGYIGQDNENESVSRTLEYAYDDWCIAQVARLLDRRDDYSRYIARAQSYKNLFDPETGFMRPKSKGHWLQPFDPREVSTSFTEANSWQYSFFVPQDINGLISLMGGKKSFGRKLDQLFAADSTTTGREQADITGLIGQYAHGNEPSHHMAYLYAYVDEPWKTQSRAQEIMRRFYGPTPDGLIGNEDCGQMSAWYVLSAAGIYPVTPGSTTYVIGAPLFGQLRFNLENGRSFLVKAQGVSPVNTFIQSARLNGKPYTRSYLSHADLMNGGELVFQMGPSPNKSWGVGPGNAPVSEINAPGTKRVGR
jgi:predicted alpha-1,2-mannosidase